MSKKSTIGSTLYAQGPPHTSNGNPYPDPLHTSVYLLDQAYLEYW